MPKRSLARALPLALALVIVLAPAASGAQSDPTSDCYAHGALTQTYTAAQLRHALQTMSPSVKEYTSCYDTIQAALLKQVGQGGGSGGSSGRSSGGSFLPTPVIVVLVILGLAGVTFGALAIRRRSAGPPGAPGSETGV